MRTADLEEVTALLGRVPEGAFEVVTRRDGSPVVIRNAPYLGDGRPMPTLYWLVGDGERLAVSRLESEGGVRMAAEAVDPGELEAAHDRYRSERERAMPSDPPPARPSGGVGGARRGVKCLHAHLAWYLAGGDDPVGRWTADQLGIDLARYDHEKER